MLYNAGLVLEGGAFRGVFTAGVLDYFMEHDLYLSSVIGVSSGACCAFNYVSHQPYRTKNCMLYQNKSDSFYGLHTFIRTHKLIDFEKLFGEYPYKQFPFDYKAYLNSDTKNEIVVTNCYTGKAEYRSDTDTPEKTSLLGQATCAVPFVVDPVMIDGVPYIDGGVTDAIPLQRSIEKGFKKNIVIMTKQEGFRSKINHNVASISSMFMRKYPAAAEAFALRDDVYNYEVSFVENKAKGDDTFLIRPEEPTIECFEFGANKLRGFYEHGYHIGRKYFKDVIKFLEKD